MPQFEREELIQCLLKELKRRNLQATPWYVQKVMQIYEMILVRHGLMIVGEHMGGKTCAYQVNYCYLKTISNFMKIEFISVTWRSVGCVSLRTHGKIKGNEDDL